MKLFERSRQTRNAAQLITINKEIKLHIGCGKLHRKGWINVDIDPRINPDILASVDDLYMFPDESVDLIEHNHLFEPLTPHQVDISAKEWLPVLKPGGVLEFECPNFARCTEILTSINSTADEKRLAMIGIYGWPPDFEEFDEDGNMNLNVFQTHKWGWSPEDAINKLKAAGFKSAKKIPVTQKQREAYRIRRDMRIRATK